MSPHAPSPNARDLAIVLNDLAWLLPRTIGAEAARADPLPPSELEVMRLLARRPGLSVNEVAAELGLQPSNVSTAVRSLVAQGILERRPDDDDRRVVRLVPTSVALQSREQRELSWGASLETVLADIPNRAALEAALPALRALANRLAGR